MTAEEWINEFSPQNQQPKTVLHASNMPVAATASTLSESSHDDESVAPPPAGATRRYPIAAICVAGLVGFAIARTF